MNRREFLKGAALGLAGLVLGKAGLGEAAAIEGSTDARGEAAVDLLTGWLNDPAAKEYDEQAWPIVAEQLGLTAAPEQAWTLSRWELGHDGVEHITLEHVSAGVGYSYTDDGVLTTRYPVDATVWHTASVAPDAEVTFTVSDNDNWVDVYVGDAAHKHALI